MKRTGFILILLLITLTATFQKDPEAIKILSEFSSKAVAAPSVKIDFTIITDNTRESDITTIEGSAVIKGDSYKVTMPDNIIWSDGKTVWSYLPDVNEVTITEPDPEDNSFLSKPSLLFTLYEDDYKVRLLEQNLKEWTIDLYPEDINLNLVRIRLKIGKAANDLKEAGYRTKDGITVTMTVSKYDISFRPTDSYFIFNPDDYKNVDVIDMR